MTGFLDVPTEILLYIFSFLDLPDLAVLARLSPMLSHLASDPILHKNRLRFVTPSRVQHSLFGRSPQGNALRPTIGDLVHRGVIRGLGMERRWRMGIYFYTQRSVIQYETSLMLARQHTGNVLSTHLKRRATIPNHDSMLKTLHQSHIFPDVEFSSFSVSRSLLPVMRKLKWSLQRDKLAKMVRAGTILPSARGFGNWLEGKGSGVVQDTERVRLAICPEVRKIVGIYERLGH